LVPATAEPYLREPLNDPFVSQHEGQELAVQPGAVASAEVTLDVDRHPAEHLLRGQPG